MLTVNIVTPAQTRIANHKVSFYIGSLCLCFHCLRGFEMSGTSDADEPCNLVLDCGTSSIKAGFAGDDAPRRVIPNLVGTPKLQFVMPNMGEGRSRDFVGEEAVSESSMLSYSYPMERGVVKDWDLMQKVLDHTLYRELRVDTDDFGAVLLSEPPMNPKANREKMAELMYETYGIRGLYFSLQGTLGMYASGRSTAIVVDMGDGVTHVAPFKGVYCWQQAVTRSHLAGSDITKYLEKLLSERGYYFETSAEQDLVREIKQKHAYVAEDFEAEVKVPAKEQTTFELPDGRTITLGDERFRCIEPYFNPALLGRELPGLTEMVYNSIMACDIHARRNLFINIYLSGGASMTPGVAERLKKEMVQLAPPSVKVNVINYPERLHSVWIGGSILASLSNFRNVVVSKQEYEEHGVGIIHKCI